MSKTNAPIMHLAKDLKKEYMGGASTGFVVASNLLGQLTWGVVPDFNPLTVNETLGGQNTVYSAYNCINGALISAAAQRAYEQLIEQELELNPENFEVTLYDIVKRS